MVQFKEVFLGTDKRDYNRAVTSQKCVRAGGKHNDLENVGYTARHHTFFEMLGNFSFGDYFKKEAIRYAWDFLTNVMALPKDKLYVTVFETDDEAYDIWKDQENVPEERIVRLGEKDNFWSMGDVGPCGPCSEILIDQGEDVGCKTPECKVGCDCDRFLEIWNLVFMQYDRDSDGEMIPLPKPSIDTGMGLERLSAVKQGVHSNYATDLFTDIIKFIKENRPDGEELTEHDKASFNVISDHSRAITFLIADGVLPSNEGRGYVLRRIIRRAARHLNMLGFKKSFLYRVSNVVIDKMKDPYIELEEKRNHIANVVKNEEDRFSDTLDKGLKMLRHEIDMLKVQKLKVLNGDVAFKLYDTFGFPLDLTADMLREEEMVVDEQGFYEEMDKQKERSKKAWSGSGEDEISNIYKELAQRGVRSKFVGYDRLEEDSKIICLVKDGIEAESATEGDEVEIITETTPFYAEAGGQVGDKGVIESGTAVIEILSTTKPFGDVHIHHGKVLSGYVKQNDSVTIKVLSKERRDTARNHSAAHLLQAALKKVLGDHVNQAGSLVTNDRLRFDFTNLKGVTERELELIERTVNEWIIDNMDVAVQDLSYDEAIKRGATALFNEKYGDVVRMVGIEDVSLELCGGTHVSKTGDIGQFKILSEGGIAAGVRRIDALTGRWAYNYTKSLEQKLDELGAIYKCSVEGVVDKTKKLIATNKELEKKIDSLEASIAKDDISDILKEAREINGVKVLSASIDNKEVKYLREYLDMFKDKLGSAVIVLASAHGGKVAVIAGVTKDLTDKYNAGKILKSLLEKFGGRGGGKPDMAQGGGIKEEDIKEALELVYSLI
jgi:alanyl-tRNA synthetase